jgi:hypothetical protein
MTSDLNTKNQIIDHIVAISLLICPNAIASESHNTNEKRKTAKEKKTDRSQEQRD